MQYTQPSPSSTPTSCTTPPTGLTLHREAASASSLTQKTSLHHRRRLDGAQAGPLVAILWGRPAQSLTPMLGRTPIIASPHPSPLSASRGFFGSRPFSRANAILTEMGAAPVDWRLP